MKPQIKVFLLLLLLTFTFNVSVFSKTDAGAHYWPKETWRASTPEKQGMDSGNIYAMLQDIKANSNVHSVLIIRNGYMVTEAYFSPYHREVRQNIYSCAKSFTSALIGIAIQQGLINDLQQKVVDIFPDYQIANLDARKKAITIENLLTMTSGLQWQGGSEDDYRMIVAKDSVRYILDRPMVSEPGISFNYNSGGTHLLSAIIQQASGINTWYFKTKYLFNTLGINPDWDCDPQGINWGGMNLYLTPMEMAKFGYLYLRCGVWNRRQIIPTEWVESSTKEQVRFPADPTNTGSYGYQWWITPYGYCDMGHGGQFIFVIPKYNMVVVLTSGIPTKFDSLVENYLLPAVKSDQPLPPNKNMAFKMKGLLREIEYPASQPIPPLPATAAKISRKVFQCEPNDAHFQSISLDFQSNESNTCLLTINWDDGRKDPTPPPVGLDRVYRIHEASFGVFALRGLWETDNTFVIHTQELRQAERIDIKLTFNQDDVSIDVIGSILGHYMTFKGKFQE